MLIKALRNNVCFNMEGAAAAAAAGSQPAAGAAAAAGAEAAGGAGAGNASDEVYFPQGLDEKFKGANNRETIDRFAQHLSGLPKPPADAKEYKIDLPKDLAASVKIAEDDVVLSAWRGIAHKHGFTQEQFNGSLGELYAFMAKEGLIEKPVDMDANFRALSDGKGDAAAQVAAGVQRTLAVRDALDALVTRQELPADDRKAFAAMFESPQGVMALERMLAKMPKPAGDPKGGGNGVAASSRTEHEKALAVLYPTMNVGR